MEVTDYLQNLLNTTTNEDAHKWLELIHKECTTNEYKSIVFSCLPPGNTGVLMGEWKANRLQKSDVLAHQMMNVAVVLEYDNDDLISQLTAEEIYNAKTNNFRKAWGLTVIGELEHDLFNFGATDAYVTHSAIIQDRLRGVALDEIHPYLIIFTITTTEQIDNLSENDKAALYQAFDKYVTSLNTDQLTWFISDVIDRQDINDDLLVRLYEFAIEPGKTITDIVNGCKSIEDYSIYEMFLNRKRDVLSVSRRQDLLGYHFELNESIENLAKLADHWSVSILQPLLKGGGTLVQAIEIIDWLTNHNQMSNVDTTVVGLLLSSISTNEDIMAYILNHPKFDSIFGYNGALTRMVEDNGDGKILQMKIDCFNCMNHKFYGSAKRPISTDDTLVFFGVLDGVNVLCSNQTNPSLGQLVSAYIGEHVHSVEFGDMLREKMETTLRKMSGIELFCSLADLKKLERTDIVNLNEVLTIDQKLGLYQLIRFDKGESYIADKFKDMIRDM